MCGYIGIYAINTSLIKVHKLSRKNANVRYNLANYVLFFTTVSTASRRPVTRNINEMTVFVIFLIDGDISTDAFGTRASRSPDFS